MLPKIEQFTHKMVRHLADRLQTQQIIWFGPQANGTSTADSDIDPLLVFPDYPDADASAKWCNAQKALLDGDIDDPPMDFFVASPGRIDKPLLSPWGIIERELEHLARHVERVTSIKLHRDTENSPCPYDGGPNRACRRVHSTDSRCPDAPLDSASRLRPLLGSWGTRSPAGDSPRFQVVSGSASSYSIAQFGRSL